MPEQLLSGGGIAERPGNMADIFHTFFGIAGLSLLEYFKNVGESDSSDNNMYEYFPSQYQMIDPTFALPQKLLVDLGASCEVNSDVTATLQYKNAGDTRDSSDVSVAVTELLASVNALTLPVPPMR